MQYRDQLISFISSITIALIFVSGLGRYRVVLVYAVYMFFSALLASQAKVLLYFLLPATIYALFLDFTKGPFMAILATNNLLLAIVLAIISDALTRKFTSATIERLSHGRLFEVCPKCNYINRELIDQCAKCGYKRDNQFELSPTRKDIARGGLAPKVMRMADIQEGEDILYVKKGYPALTVIINGIRENRILFIVTSNKIIFLDYYRIPIRHSIGYRERDLVPISEIIRVEAKMQNFLRVEGPFLIITTSNEKRYELRFNRLTKYREHLAEIIGALQNINPNIEANINIEVRKTQSDWNLPL